MSTASREAIRPLLMTSSDEDMDQIVKKFTIYNYEKLIAMKGQLYVKKYSISTLEWPIPQSRSIKSHVCLLKTASMRQQNQFHLYVTSPFKELSVTAKSTFISFSIAKYFSTRVPEKNASFSITNHHRIFFKIYIHTSSLCLTSPNWIARKPSCCLSKRSFSFQFTSTPLSPLFSPI